MECPSKDELEQYVFGLINDDRSLLLENHFASCLACQSSLTSQTNRPDPLTQALKSATDTAELSDVCRSQLSRSMGLLAAEVGSRSAKGISQEQTFVNQHTPKVTGPDNVTTHQTMVHVDSPQSPNLICQYELLGKIGAGGMGTVYEARHRHLGKPVAIKLLEKERDSDRKSMIRFEREMKAIGKLEHPHIVRAFDAGVDDGRHFLVMELLRGRDLGQLAIADRTWPVPDACEAVRQAALGLSCAHGNGLVHRDIKPSNLFLTTEGIIKILDLGLARLVDEARTDGLSDSMTILGTVEFMAPEQALDCRAADARSDIYSLAATLFRMLTGTSPVEAPADSPAMQRLLLLTTVSPTSVSVARKDLPSGLGQLIDQCLMRNPDSRVATAEKFAEKLLPFCAGADLRHLPVLLPWHYREIGQGSSGGAEPQALQIPAASKQLLSVRRTYRDVAIAGLSLLMVSALLTAFLTNLPWERGTSKTTSFDKHDDSDPTSLNARDSRFPKKPAGISELQMQFASDHQIPVEFTSTIGMKFRLIPPGEFTMGSSANEIDELLTEASQANKPKWFLENIRTEGPAHRVRITHAFYVAVYETTIADFRQMIEKEQYVPESIQDGLGGVYNGTTSDKGLSWELPFPGSPARFDEPVRQVTWNDAQHFCKWLSSLEHREYRLLTEAEWEYACRAGTWTRFYTGETLSTQQARIVNQLPGNVGEYPANPWGLHDMLGNVSEWCEDQIGDNYTDLEVAEDPLEIRYPDDRERVLRGGAAFEEAPRPAQRRAALPSVRADTIGFRVACSPIAKP